MKMKEMKAHVRSAIILNPGGITAAEIHKWLAARKLYAPITKIKKALIQLLNEKKIIPWFIGDQKMTFKEIQERQKHRKNCPKKSCCRCGASAIVDCAALITLVEMIEEALRFYADKKNWREDCVICEDFCHPLPAILDAGQRAREALARCS